MEGKSMKLVPNAKKAGSWFSMQAMALAAAIQGAWLATPPELQALVPADWVNYGTVAVLVLGAIGRVVDQGRG
jgi:hypothetical protein